MYVGAWAPSACNCSPLVHWEGFLDPRLKAYRLHLDLPLDACTPCLCPLRRHMFNMPTPQFDNSKIQRELGLTFLDRKTTLKDQVEKMKQLGLLPKFRG